MSSIKYMSLDKNCKPADLRIEPKDAAASIVCLDGSGVQDAIYFQADWLKKPFVQTGMVAHDSDKLMVFIGSDPDDHENLNAEIELWIENDLFTFTEPSIFFIPRGVAHGRMKAKSVTKPVVCYFTLMNSSYYQEQPARAAARAGTYADNRIVKYAPVDGFLPSASEASRIRLLWIDSKKLAGSPYMEALWFRTENEIPGPETHEHDFDELIGFLSSDPDDPDELHGEVTLLLDGETLTLTKSCVAYIPKGVTHSPMLVSRLDRPIIHFTGGNGGNYGKRGIVDVYNTGDDYNSGGDYGSGGQYVRSGGGDDNANPVSDSTGLYRG